MRRVALVIRLFAAFTLAFWLAGATSLSSFAQDGDATPSAEESPVEEQAIQGTLTIYVFTCSDGLEGVAGALFLEGEFAPSEECVEEGTASISIDGGAAEAVTSGAQYTLDEGPHTVAEDVLDLNVEIAVAEQVPAAVYAVYYTAPEVDAVPGTVSIMTHLCPAEIETVEDFNALGGFIEKVQACPVITLPGNDGPEGAIDGNDPEAPLSFDYAVVAGETSLGIGNATFMPEELCEADQGDINGDPNDNVCLDTSNYAFADVSQGPVTVTEVAPPEGYQFGALEFTPDSGDDATLLEAVADEARIELDTTGDDSAMLHVYNFQKPVENRVSIVKHQCPETIDADAFAALGGYLQKIATCPVVLRGGDDGPAGAINGGHRTFAFEIQGSDGVVQTLEDNATFVPSQVCEDALGDINGNPNDNVCLDSSSYQLDGVLQGPGVLVIETKSSKGYEYGGVELDPATDDAASLVGASDDGVIELDTSLDGNVTLHVFNVKAPEPEPTPTPTEEPEATATPTEEPEPTEEPSTTGTVQIIKLFCYGPVEETIINALAPGESAGSEQMGDSSCVSGNADFFISLFGADDQPSFFVGDDGVEAIELPVTDGGLHSLTEIYSGAVADFAIDPGVMTRVIVLNYVLEEEIDRSGEEEEDDPDSGLGGETLDDGEEALGDAVASDVNDEETILSGEDLAETGAGPAAGPTDGSLLVMLGGLSILLLAGAAGVRRRSA